MQRFGDRPTVVEKDGWKISLSVHDAAYMAASRVFKRRLMESHPDAGGSHGAFNEAKRSYEAWKAREAKWYETHGQTPPDTRRRSNDELECPTPYAFKATTAVWRLLKDGRIHSRAEVAAAAGGGSRYLYARSIELLRKRGAEIITVNVARSVHYQLIDASKYRPPRQFSAPSRVARLLQGGASLTAKQIREGAELRNGQVYSAIARLRDRGARILLDRETRTYRLDPTKGRQ